jgi:hypothetical protein
MLRLLHRSRCCRWYFTKCRCQPILAFFTRCVSINSSYVRRALHIHLSLLLYLVTLLWIRMPSWNPPSLGTSPVHSSTEIGQAQAGGIVPQELRFRLKLSTKTKAPRALVAYCACFHLLTTAPPIFMASHKPLIRELLVHAKQDAGQTR